MPEHTLPGGATRSEKAPAYYLVPGYGWKRVAQRFALGAEVHGPKNWLRSLDTEEHAAAFAQEAFNHMQEHMRRMHEGLDPEDDHLGAIGWGVEALAMIEEHFGKPWTQLKEANHAPNSISGGDHGSDSRGRDSYEQRRGPRSAD